MQEKENSFKKKVSCHHRKQKMKSFKNHEEFLARIAKSLYYVDIPFANCTSLPVTELASEIFSEVNKLSLNRLDIEKAAHLSRNAHVSPCLLVLALLYLERLKSSNPKYLTKVSPTELFLISLMVGSKFLLDDGEGDDLSNTEWAYLTGLSVQDINKAEKQFLDAINWEVFVSKEEFWNRFNSLETKVGLRQGCKRGWFTYTELNLLLQLIDLTTVAQCFWNVTTACLLSYTASVLALVGSALLVNQITGLGLKSKVPTTEVTPNDWEAASPVVLLPDCNGIQDCNASSPLEFTTETKTNESEFLRLCGSSRWNEKTETVFTNAFNLDLFNGLYLHLSRDSFLHVKNLITISSKEGSSLFLLSGFNVWTWSDYIRNYLIKNSAPGVFYSVSSF